MMRGTAVSGGQQRRATWKFRVRWAAGKATWNDFAGIPWQAGRGEMLPGTLSREFRARWEAERCHLEHFRRDSVPGGR